MLFSFKPPSLAGWIQAVRVFLPWRRERDIRRRGPCHLASVLSGPFPLSSQIGSGIMTLTGTLFRKVVITQIHWTSGGRVHPRGGSQYGGAVRKQPRSPVMCCGALPPSLSPPLGITIAHYGGRRVELKNNPISHSSSVDIQSA